MRERLKTLAFCLGPAALFAWCWLRLERPHVETQTAVWLAALGVLPALLPRLSWRLAALAAASVLALHTALHEWAYHPVRLASGFGHGFLEFYDVRLPFLAAHHPRMESVILVAFFVSCAAVGLAVAARHPVRAAFVLLVAAGWPATLLAGPDDLWRGTALLAVTLSLVLGLGGSLHPRRFAVGTAVGTAIVAVAFGISNSSAIASGQVLHWQGWDFYTKPAKPVDISYVWNSDYRGLHFPKKVTVVLRIKAPSQPTYWRATTLDEFDGGNWFESVVPTVSVYRHGRDELTRDPELPAAARDSSKWVRQDVTVGALRDNHLVGASVPVAYAATHGADYAAGGTAYLQGRPLSPGDEYTVWSYQAKPTPRQLARLEPRYPEQVRAVDLLIAPHATVPPFGAPNRDAAIDRISRNYRAGAFTGLYGVARRVVGRPTHPYAAALELEAWFRSGAFRYDVTPPQDPGTPALVSFVLRTHRGYCQHFAGAMALMLRYLGIPARVAAGFTSGSYDRSTGQWSVTDHDAHTWVEAWFPRYGWLPFDPTPGRGNLQGPYTSSSPHFDLADGLFAVGAHLRKAKGAFDLRKLRGRVGGAAAKPVRPAARPRPAGGSPGFGALLKLLAVVAAGLALATAATKVLVRRRRYLTRDPRRVAAACVRELRDYLTDQGARPPASATLQELADLVEREIGVSAQAFVEAAAAARFGPAAEAGAAAREARRELKRLRARLRAALSRPERALGLVSLRSLGLTG